MCDKPGHSGQQHTNDAYAPVDDLIVALVHNRVHHVVHFSEHLVHGGNFFIHTVQSVLNGIVTFSTQLNVRF